jgi:hypothetical protein
MTMSEENEENEEPEENEENEEPEEPEEAEEADEADEAEEAENEERLGAEKRLTRSQLQDWINDNEAIIGPIKGINCAPGGTVGTFDIDGDPPSGPVRVMLDPEGTAECPGSSEEVCRGRAYVSNNCVKVLICR